MEESLASTPPAPRYTGMRYLDMDTADIMSIMINYSYNGAWYCVLVGAQEARPGYELDQSIEGKILIELSDLSWGEESEEKDRKITQLQSDLARLAGDACLLLMKTLTPLPVPEEQTFQDHLYPEIHTLQVFTEGGKLVSHKLDGYDLPERHPPIPESRLQEIGLDDTIPVLKPSEIMLGTRLQGLVWKVNVNGEDMICKITFDIFEDAIGRELETYQKIRNADLGNDLKVPQLKGIIQSHTGVVGVLLGYIPHKHHNLRLLLQDVGDGTLPETEATASMKRKWAGQIKQSLAHLHKLGILWGDIKTDNVLIDDNGDAYLVDFGGGNTVGWVDHDKYDTVEGDLQGLQKMLVALGEE
ncbi:hypothetical protein QBC33DRAFT_573601 [Phialemonium atrogriseum]|uniref:Protein kinase domain-containing protein n=1 Tax=Phialemonium atrogriseum TaxID=1093897 RepID=A0AAJ0BTZ1_9PEZI|nr:uncharacterized protein QBC33DRAFT_573601 [Phialemonium atrogriseum]KAK1763084.1 hypothetical protein QBC33DRAFT_573601 [Phialemonium atrogriseum]